MLTNKIIGKLTADPEHKKNILLLEEMLMVSLPADLREILINYDDARFERKLFFRIVNSRFSQQMSVEKILTPGQIISSQDILKDDSLYMENKLVVFGETLGSPLICIAIEKENYGNVFVFDWDFGATKIASSFKEFAEFLQ